MNENLRLAESVNRHCICQTLDKPYLEKELSKNLGDDLLLKNFSNMFSQTVVYISEFTLKEVEDLVKEIESAIKSESFYKEVLKDVPEVALKDFGTEDASFFLVEIDS